jgi:glycosyltransferase involved in cell wall biosynthesis
LSTPFAKSLRATAFSGGWNVPGARFRIRQFAGPLRQHGITLVEWPAPLGAYPPLNRSLRPVWALGSLAARVPGIVDSWRSDVTLFQRELLSTFMTLEPLTRGPRVLDVDDAIWLNGDGRFADRLAQRCERIICGNAWLAEYFGRITPNIDIVPTGIDVAIYRPGGSPAAGPRRIGWIGTLPNMRYLTICQAAIGRVLQRHPDVELAIVCDHRPPPLPDVPPARVRHIPWSQAAEVSALQSFAVGIMPLDNTDWERGKCSFKMLQYMACGVPVVVSPVGMNAEVLGRGGLGFAARTAAEWEDALEALLTDPDRAQQMGQEGRRVVERHFSVDVLAERVAASLRAAVR